MKARSLAEAKREASTCTLCPLEKGRTQVVYGVGHPNADLMFIGEAPGKHEDQQGEPFVGDSGKLLNAMLCEIGILRKEVYIANVLKCLPPNDRDPHVPEIEACAPWLDEQIRLVNPKLLVPLGVFATCRILDKKVLIRDVHGQRFVRNGRTIIPTFHPAWILRGGGPDSQRMQAFREDFATIRAALGSG